MRIGSITDNAKKRLKSKYIAPNKENTVSAIRQIALTFSDAGKIAVWDALNTLYAKGAAPRFLSVSLSLPPEFEESEALAVMEQLSLEAGREAVPLTNADVMTFTQIQVPILSLMAAGDLSKDSMGDCGKFLVMAGHAGMAAIGIIAKEKREELLNKFAPSFIDKAEGFIENCSVRNITKLLEKEKVYMYSLKEGGVYGGLWELADGLGKGLEVNLRDIPIRQETVEISEVFKLHPYRLLSTGAMLIVCNDPEEIIDKLNAEGIQAACIGSLNDGNDRVIINDTDRSFIELPREDDIYKLF